MKVAIADIEGDNLLPMTSKVWIVCVKDTSSEEIVSLYSREEFEEWFFDVAPDRMVWHNGVGFDLPALRKVWGIPYGVGRKDSFFGRDIEIVDTFLLSSFLNADRSYGHSLEGWGEHLGFPKMNFREELIKIGALERGAPKGDEFKAYHPLMDEYCRQDVRVTERVFLNLLKESENEYG